MADSSGGDPKSSDSGAIYHEVSTKKLLAVKIYGAITAVFVVIAMIFCIAKGKDDSHYFLLLINLIISSLVGVAVMWWYRKGDLAADKLWFLALVASVILFQCITADIYVWGHSPQSQPSITTVAPPPTRVTPSNLTNITTAAPPKQLMHQKLQTSLPSSKEQIRPPGSPKKSPSSHTHLPPG